jgi:ferric-dicitrate binding protein FerR (iron transport regulator)
MTDHSSHSIDPAVLDRVFARTATRSDEALVNAWTDADPVRARWVEAILAPRGRHVDTETALARLKPSMASDKNGASAHNSMLLPGSRMLRGETQTLRPHTRWYGRGGNPPIPSWLRAGIVTAVIGIVGALLVVAYPVARTVPATRQQYHTVLGQRSTVTLTDGSVVRLAPATSVTVAGRDVTVDGEAQFMVTANANRPFTVRTRSAMIRVLGTAFVVRHYAEEKASRVVVADGRVTVQRIHGARNFDDTPILAAGMLAQINDSGIVVKRGVTAEQYTGTVTGELVFEQVQLGEVLHDLARSYNTQLRITDSTLARTPVTMTARVAQHSLGELLSILATTVNAHTVVKGHVILLVPGRAPAPAPRTNHPTVKIQPEASYGR